MTKNSPETPLFDSIDDAFDYFIDNIYKSVPADVKSKYNLHVLKRDHTQKGNVSQKRKNKILKEVIGYKIKLMK